MLMPALLPENLEIYQAAENEEKLFGMLQANPSDLVYFFAACCDDETWCDTYPSFVKQVLVWLTECLFSAKLNVFLGNIAAKAVQKHYRNLMTKIPLNIIFQLEDDITIVSSLLFQGISLFFYDLIRANCFEKGENKVSLAPTRIFEFKIIQEYVYTGDVKELWRLEKSEILKVLQLARFYQLSELSRSCEELYLRYISINNLMDSMALSEKQNLELVRKKCCELFNSLQTAIIFTPVGTQDLVCDFTVSTATTQEQLKTWSPYVTHFIAGSQVMEDPNVISILQECRRLRSVDIGKTQEYHNIMLELTRFKELILSGCLWLQDQNFKKLISAFPQIEKLDLTSCSRITSMAWGELTKLPRLNSLNLTRCEELDDEAFGLILASARHLSVLELNGCRNLTKASFHALAISKQSFDHLGVGRTGLEDANLLEITSRIQTLRFLDLTRCQHLTEQGIFDALKIAPSLKEVSLAHTEIGEKALEDLKQLKPYLQIST